MFDKSMRKRYNHTIKRNVDNGFCYEIRIEKNSSVNNLLMYNSLNQ